MSILLSRLRFCIRHGKTWRDTWLLYRLTILFVLGRRLPWLAIDLQSRHTYSVTLTKDSQGYVLMLRLQDMPILYEVWMDKCYHFSSSMADTTVLDIGANVGLASIYFHHMYPSAHVIAIEPSATNVTCLVYNTSKIPLITVIPKAVVATSGTVYMNCGGLGYNHKVTNDGEGQPVSGLTVADILALANTNGPIVMKMDIEGGELAIFDGDVSWLNSIDELVIEVHSEPIRSLVSASCGHYGLLLVSSDRSIDHYRRS